MSKNPIIPLNKEDRGKKAIGGKPRGMHYNNK
jgi:hypothetical protein